MKLFFYTIGLLAIFVLISSCNKKTLCPAYRTSGTGIAIFNEDGSPIGSGNIKKDTHGLVEKGKKKKGPKTGKYKDPRKKHRGK